MLKTLKHAPGSTTPTRPNCESSSPWICSSWTTSASMRWTPPRAATPTNC
jgi:hypothetical protein